MGRREDEFETVRYRGRVRQGLNPQLLIVGHRPSTLLEHCLEPKHHLPIDVQHLLHFDLKLGGASLQIVLDLVRLHGCAR